MYKENFRENLSINSTIFLDVITMKLSLYTCRGSDMSEGGILQQIIVTKKCNY